MQDDDPRVSPARSLLDLPLDIIWQIAARTTIPTRLSLWLTCKSLHSHPDFLRLGLPIDNKRALASFLRTLERDLPLNHIFCDCCLKFHIVSTESSRIVPRNAHQWKCAKEDSRAGTVQLYLDRDLAFWMNRMALKLFRLDHPNAQRYIQSLETVRSCSPSYRVETGVFSVTRYKAVHDIEGVLSGRQNRETDPGPKMNLLLRHQQWNLMTPDHMMHWAKMLASDCYDTATWSWLCWHTGTVSHCDLRNDGQTCRGSVPIIPGYVEESADHCYGPLRKCQHCGTEWRLDFIRFPWPAALDNVSPCDSTEAANDGSQILLVGGASVITKWMDLGDGWSRSSFGWKSKLRWTNGKHHKAEMDNSRLLEMFEGHDQRDGDNVSYVPQITRQMAEEMIPDRDRKIRWLEGSILDT